MRPRKGLLSCAAPFALSLLLTGCSVGPSEQELQKALQNEVESVNELAVIMMGDQAAERLDIEVVAVHKWGCRADQDQSYICDVEVKLNSAKAGPHTQKTSVRMAKDDNGWMVIKEL